MLHHLPSRRSALVHGTAAALLLPFCHVDAASTRGQPDQASRRSRPKAAAPLPLVMLDPGHGGKDPGAIGATGTYEKYIALAAATELQRVLLKSGRYRVELTRHTDVFIHLDDRVGHAQERKADLFVSMHADALTDPSVRGASVYTLASTASDAQSAALARRENSADRVVGGYAQGVSPEVAKILASLVRQETRVASTRVSRSLVAELEHATLMLPNPARHAGFVVLKAPDVPSVLVEMGFMSSPRDEAALQRADHRAKIVAAMHRSVDDYFAALGHGLITSS